MSWDPAAARRALERYLADFLEDEVFPDERADIKRALKNGAPLQDPVYFGAFCWRVLGHIPREFDPAERFSSFDRRCISRPPTVGGAVLRRA